MAVQFEYVFTGKRCGGREVENDTAIDRFALAVGKLTLAGDARRRQIANELRCDFFGVGGRGEREEEKEEEKEGGEGGRERRRGGGGEGGEGGRRRRRRRRRRGGREKGGERKREEKEGGEGLVTCNVLLLRKNRERLGVDLGGAPLHKKGTVCSLTIGTLYTRQ